MGSQPTTSAKNFEKWSTHLGYKFISNPKEKNAGEEVIEIISGPFEGLIYKYGSFKFKRPESKEEEHLRAQFTFDILYIPEEVRDVTYPDEMKESFDRLLLEVLLDIIMKKIENDKREEHDNTNGKGDIDESFERRVVYEFDNSVSEE